MRAHGSGVLVEEGDGSLMGICRAIPRVARQRRRTLYICVDQTQGRTNTKGTWVLLPMERDGRINKEEDEGKGESLRGSTRKIVT